MWWKIFDEDELPWMRRRTGESFLRAVSLMERRPWGVEMVNEDMVVVEWATVGCVVLSL